MMKYHFNYIFKPPAALLLAVSASVMLAGCGGGIDAPLTGASAESTLSDTAGAAAVDSGGGTTAGLAGNPASSYSVGGSLTGLKSGTLLVLRNNGSDSRTLSANGAFTFATKLTNAAPYAVTVYTQPAGQKCTVTNANGTIKSANVTNISVACVASLVATYSVGGSVSGLNSGAALVLRNNGGDNLTRGANGVFTFATKLANAAPYAVTVYTQPVGQKCTVTNASGAIPAANVANVGVACVTSTTTPTAKALFKSNFGPGVSLGVPKDFSTKGAYQDLVGTDRETGYTWPVAALGANFSGVQLIAPGPIDALTIGNYNKAELRTVSGPSGSPVSELFLNTVDNGGVGNLGSAQTDFLIRRPWSIGDVTKLYTTYWIKLQANLATSLDPMVSSGNWKAITEFKTGGATHPVTGLRYGGGDYRIKVVILKNTAGELYWVTAADDGANWVTTNSTGAEINCPRVPECPLKTYWRVDNHTVPVPVGTWAKMEVYWNRSSGADGRYWVAVNGQVIADHLGSTMGEFGLPITRIFSTLAYSGGHSPNEAHTTGLEFWDGFPCGEGKSCYVAPTH